MQQFAVGWPPREAGTPGHGRCGRCGRLMLTRGVWQQADALCFSCRPQAEEMTPAPRSATSGAKWVA